MHPINKPYAFVSPYFRRRRIRWFRRELVTAPEDNLLDAGGYHWFWQDSGLKNPITLPNLAFDADLPRAYPAITYLTRDACRLPCADGSFTVLFSNSVIEHVGTWERQQQFAAETRRVGRRLWGRQRRGDLLSNPT